MAKKPRYELFETDIIREKNFKVEREKEIIRDIAVVTKGVTKDGRGEFDDEALETIVKLGNKLKLGAKSRFGHPNLSDDGLGDNLGRTKNFRREGDVVKGDLHINPTAHESPGGDLANFVIKLAETDPDAFGASMVIYWDPEQRKDEEGQLLKDEDGELLPPLIRVKDLFSVDIVDDPAANDGLFGVPFFSKSAKFAAGMTDFFNRFLKRPDAVDRAIAFLSRYQFNRDDYENRQTKKEVKTMLENLTIDELKKERQDLFDSIRKDGFEEGLKAGKDEALKLERERCLSILKESKGFKDMTDLAVEAVEKGLTFEQALITFQKKQLEGIKAATPGSPGPDNDEDKGKKKSHLERAKAYKEEHNSSMTEALQKTAEKRTK